MNTKLRFFRLVLASSVGSILWAGCAEPRLVTANFDPALIAYAPVDLTKRRPDTHPELRSAMWQTVARNAGSSALLPAVADSTLIGATAYDMPITVTTREPLYDSTYLLVFNQEVVNVATTPPGAWSFVTGPQRPATTVVTTPGGVVVEAAGAQPGVPAVEAGRLTPAQQRWRGGTITTQEY